MMHGSLGGYLSPLGCPFCGWFPGMGFGFFGWAWAIFMAIFWVLVIAGVILVIRWLMGQSRPHGTAAQRRTALDILDERYAKGEISDEEYERRKRLLQS